MLVKPYKSPSRHYIATRGATNQFEGQNVEHTGLGLNPVLVDIDSDPGVASFDQYTTTSFFCKQHTAYLGPYSELYSASLRISCKLREINQSTGLTDVAHDTVSLVSGYRR